MERTEIKLRPQEGEDRLIKIIEKKAGGHPAYFKIVRKSLDARDRDNIFWRYCLEYSMKPYAPPVKTYEKIKTRKKCVIVGAGPAGLFCSVRLIDMGICPVIIERGQKVEERRISCGKFFSSLELDTESNVQFGEGGAGAFSDGKLNTQTRDGFNRDVLETFVRFGAPEEILYLNKPHVGSDRLYDILKNIRAYIEGNGGTYLFDTRLTGIETRGGAVSAAVTENVRTGERRDVPADFIVLAVGHSARDTFEMLSAMGISMERRDFAVGVRIEHLSEEIGRAQYGEMRKYLPAADYKLVSHAGERTVFTFCMCPGGVVMPASSEEGGIAVNGMSEYARAGANSNSALMVQMTGSDLGADDLFAGMRFQRAIERRAYEVSGSFRAPVQLYGDFAAGRMSSSFGRVMPTYAAGTEFRPLGDILPPVAVSSLKAAIPDMGRRLKSFDCPDALLTGVETRFTSPVRIIRDGKCESVSVKGLYPCGEGSGYSGGITSSAADGIRAAEEIISICRDNA